MFLLFKKQIGSISAVKQIICKNKQTVGHAYRIFFRFLV